MATIRKELKLSATPDKVWAAFEDVGAIHTRLAQGFVTDTELVPAGRDVTFANGFQAFEALITVDKAARRLAYAVQNSPNLTHHSASFEIGPDGSGTKVVWIADLLPDAMAPMIGGMMEEGVKAMRKTLDG